MVWIVFGRYREYRGDKSEVMGFCSYILRIFIISLLFLVCYIIFLCIREICKIEILLMFII